MYFLRDKREIYRIHVAHTVRSLALSFVSIYIPVYLLTQGYSIAGVIAFFAVFHGLGLLYTFGVVVPLMQRIGLVRIFKWYFPLELSYYLSLYLMGSYAIPWWIVACLGGMATFTYWVPLNILLLKHADFDKMGSDLATFFALPKFFGIIAPLISAVLVWAFGFWTVFVIAFVGIMIAYVPIAPITKSTVTVRLHWRSAWRKLRHRKRLFFLESLDNIVEESDWYWDICVYMMIGSLAVPGIVGSLSALGGALFFVFLGKRTDRGNIRHLIVLAALCVAAVSLGRIFVSGHILAYMLTVAGAFAMTFLLVPYFSYIYKSVKDADEEEFIILREIPTVLGRMVVFGVIIVTLQSPQYFFIFPALVAIMLGSIFFLPSSRGHR